MTTKMHVGKTLMKVVDWLFPANCALCQSRVDQGHICGSCWGKISFISHPFCQCCAYPLACGEAELDVQFLCAACLQKKPFFSQSRSIFLYDPLSRGLILPFKHRGKLYLGRLLAQWMAAVDPNFFQGIDVVIPVPLHWTRLIKRGFNQAQVLAKHIAKYQKIENNPFVLKRQQRTPSQGGLGQKERAKNVRNVFQVNPRHKKGVIGKTVLLVDDVMTSGATLNECSRVLLLAGVKEVRTVTAARVG